jgi:hypothetical protein
MNILLILWDGQISLYTLCSITGIAPVEVREKVTKNDGCDECTLPAGLCPFYLPMRTHLRQ